MGYGTGGGESSKVDKRGSIDIFMIQPHCLATKEFSMELNVCHQGESSYNI